MKLSGKLAFGCLVLCVVLIFGGCSRIPNPFSDDSSKKSKTDMNLDGIKEQQQTSAEKVVQLESEITRLKASADKDKNDCDTMTEQSKSSKTLILPDTKTSKQCDKAKGSAEAFEKKRDELSQARMNVRNLEQQIPAVRNDENNSDKTSDINLMSWVYPLLIGLLGLSALAIFGAAAYKLFGSIKQERQNNLQEFERANRKNQELTQRIEKLEKREVYQQVEELEETAKRQSSQLTQIQTAIQSLQRQTAEGGGRQDFQPPVVHRREPQFPVAAENYLSKVGADAPKATADLIGGLLVNDLSKGSEFLIVKDYELPTDMFYAVPSQIRFDMKGDYHNFYEKYYDCKNPSGGAVWIISPTTVRRVEGGWQLVNKGELETKQ